LHGTHLKAIEDNAFFFWHGERSSLSPRLAVESNRSSLRLGALGRGIANRRFPPGRAQPMRGAAESRTRLAARNAPSAIVMERSTGTIAPLQKSYLNHPSHRIPRMRRHPTTIAGLATPPKYEFVRISRKFALFPTLEASSWPGNNIFGAVPPYWSAFHRTLDHHAQHIRVMRGSIASSPPAAIVQRHAVRGRLWRRYVR